MTTADGAATSLWQDSTAGLALRLRVEEFYAHEGELLDDRRLTEWVELFDVDARYWIPTRMTLPIRERHREIASEHEPAIIDEDLTMLRGRVRRTLSLLQWSEEPPSRTRHLITNVRVDSSRDDRIGVRSNFIVYRSRSERHEDWFVGERFDVLRAVEEGARFRIAERKLVLDQTTLLAPSMSVFL